MSLDTAKKAVDFAVSLGYKDVIVSFVTAESLMEWDLVKSVIRYSEKMGVRRFDLGTNSLLLDKRILKFFSKHNVVPMISVDGIKEAQNVNRVYEQNKGTFEILDKKLDLLRKNFNKHIEIRVTITPETLPFLSKTIQYVINKGLAYKTRINVSPVVDRGQWQRKNYSMFENQLFQVADIFIANFRKNKLINICSSECFPMNFTFLNLVEQQNTMAQSCCGGGTNINIAQNGDIYPCYFLSSVRYNKKDDLICGNIENGIGNPEILAKFQGINPNMSCFAWNYLIGGDTNRPLEMYRELFKIWLKVSEYVTSEIKK